MNLNATRRVDPLQISGSFDFTTDDLESIFTPDAGPEVEQLFYHIFNDKAWQAKKVSEQYALLQDLARRKEELESRAANLAGTLSKPQPK